MLIPDHNTKLSMIHHLKSNNLIKIKTKQVWFFFFFTICNNVLVCAQKKRVLIIVLRFVALKKETDGTYNWQKSDRMTI